MLLCFAAERLAQPKPPKKNVKKTRPRTCFCYLLGLPASFAFVFALLFAALGFAEAGAKSEPSVTTKPGQNAAAALPAEPERRPYPAPPDHRDTQQRALLRAKLRAPNSQRAERVIVFLGDGMGVSTVTAARILAGQNQGSAGEEHWLAWEGFPFSAFVKAFNTNQQVADSAGAASALFGGQRTKAGVLGLGPQAIRGDCASARDAFLPNLFEIAAAAGLATGLVTDTRITHATPAATFAHSPERSWESDATIPEQAAKEGCEDIASQLLGSELDVILGGGSRAFFPQGKGGEKPVRAGERLDGRDLVQSWLALGEGRHFVSRGEELASLRVSETKALLGLFADSHLEYRYQRSKTDQPTLAQMTTKAIEVLDAQAERWLLLVEGGRIDHGHHEGRAAVALDETIGFSEAVAAALSMVDTKDTLVVVTADHSHTLTIGGYPTRGNPILGTVVGNDARGFPLAHPTLASDGLPFTTLSYANGPGSRTDQRADLSAVDTTSFDFQQPALYKRVIKIAPDLEIIAETHAGEDVPLWAQGPGAYLFGGTIDQPFVFHALREAMKLGSPVVKPRAKR